MIRQMVSATALVAVALGLAACTGQDVKRSLGMKRNQPDAFQVVSRPPLSVPPVYHLRPPADAPEASVSADARAESLLLNGEELPRRRAPDDSYYTDGQTAVADVESSGLGTQADTVFLQKAGASRAQPDIRAVLAEETQAYEQQVVETEDGFLEKLNPFERKDGDPVVDAQAEAERIRKAREEGEPLNKGEVEEIDPKEEGVF